MHPGAYAAQMQIAMEGIDESVRQLCAKFDLSDAVVDLNAISHRDPRIVQLRRIQAANDILKAVLSGIGSNESEEKPAARRRGRPAKAAGTG